VSLDLPLIELVILFFLASLQLTLSSVRLLPYTVKKKKQQQLIGLCC